MNLRRPPPIWQVVEDLRCHSCQRISWDRSDGCAVVAFAFGEVVVLVEDGRRGPATWICGYCGRTVETGSTLEEELEGLVYGVPAEGE